MNELNKSQRAAVEHVRGPLLVLAGAGTGKTRVICYRMANLVTAGHAEPKNVLALTFTRQAAHEMRARLSTMLPQPPMCSTFHSIGFFILRDNPEPAGLEPGFSVLGDSEQRSLIASVRPRNWSR